MQLRHVNTYFVHQLKFRLIVFTVVFTLFAVILYYNLANSGSEKEYKDESNDLQKKVNDLKSYIEKSDSSIKIWNDEIKKRHSERPGLKVEEFKKTLDQLKDTYNIQNLIVNLLTPEQRSDIGALKFITIRSSNLNLSFSAYNDIDVYQFLLALENQVPGYLQVKSISILAIPEVSNDVARSIAATGGRDVVTVKVEMVWQDIQDINQPTPPTQTENK